MIRTTFLAVAIAAGAAFTIPTPSHAQTAAAPTATAPAMRMMTTASVGQRVIRQVMINDNGGTIDIVYDMPAGQPQSQRVLRLENVNGMLQVIYDNSVPSMALGAGGAPRLVQQGSGMYEVVYGAR